MHLKIDLLMLVVACVGYAVTQEVSYEGKNDSSTIGTGTMGPTPTSATVTDTSPSNKTSPGPHTSAGTTQHVTSAHTSHSEGTTTGPPPLEIWSVKGEGRNGTYCILLKAAFLIEFKYKNTKNESVTSTLHLANTNGSVVVNGSCDSHKQSIELSFLTNWMLTLTYEKTNDKSYYQSGVQLVWDLTKTHFDGAPRISGDNQHMEAMFNTSKTGYLCLARMRLYDNTSVENGLLNIYSEQMKLEAFQEKKEAKFSDQYERCKEDTISNLVPIIVGACLGGLIIIVLIAYLIGRKRSRRGYESV